MEIDWDSVIRKAQKHMQSPNRKREAKEKFDRVMLGFEVTAGGVANLYDIADTFAAVLYRSILSAGLHPSVEDRLIDTRVGEPKKLPNGNYIIPVYFENNLDRSSMSTYKDYGYDINIAKLYNNGVDHTMKQIIEYDNGLISKVSNTYIPATHFAEDAINTFMTAYGKEFGVIRVEDTFNDL